MEWHEDASALYAGICEANRLTQGLPVRVTEHGSGDNDSHDVKRQLSLQQAVHPNPSPNPNPNPNPNPSPSPNPNPSPSPGPDLQVRHEAA